MGYVRTIERFLGLATTNLFARVQIVLTYPKAINSAIKDVQNIAEHSQVPWIGTK